MITKHIPSQLFITVSSTALALASISALYKLAILKYPDEYNQDDESRRLYIRHIFICAVVSGFVWFLLNVFFPEMKVLTALVMVASAYGTSHILKMPEKGRMNVSIFALVACLVFLGVYKLGSILMPSATIFDARPPSFQNRQMTLGNNNLQNQ